MKGIVFTELLQHVESKFGLEMVDKIVKESKLEYKGLYSVNKAYNFSKMLQLLNSLSANTNISIDDLLLVYSEHFFSVLKKSHNNIFSSYTCPIEMLSSIGNHIYLDVKRDYPTAEVPSFIIEEKTKNSIVMVYKSSRAMYSFGLGLMYKTFENYNTTATIKFEKIRDDGTEVKFFIQKN
jgi:hypothetical protein